jgi:hypothetical protein
MVVRYYIHQHNFYRQAHRWLQFVEKLIFDYFCSVGEFVIGNIRLPMDLQTEKLNTLNKNYCKI